MNFIYHYCSINAFYLIMQNKCIRLSDLNKTNDYMEKRWSKKYIQEVLKEELNNYNINLNLKDYYINNEANKSYLEYYNEEMNKVLFDNRPILSTCFSEEKDKLSQWRAYGQDGEGLSIGFDFKVIKQVKNKNILVEKVIYREDKQKKRLGEIVRSSIKSMEKKYYKIKKKHSIDFDRFFKENFNIFCKILIAKLENISCVIKNPAFSEEKEVRIIYDPEMFNPEINGPISICESKRFFEKELFIKGYKITPIKFILRKNQLIAYCNIDFSGYINDVIIREIIIGPKCKLSKMDLYYFLLENGYDSNKIEIIKSKATYR